MEETEEEMDKGEESRIVTTSMVLGRAEASSSSPSSTIIPG